MSQAARRILVLLTVSLGADASDEPPAVGRPEDFSGIVGTYEIGARAVPTDLQVEQPLTLTVTITDTSGKAPAQLTPRRSALRVFPRSLARDYYVEALPDPSQPNPHSWEFAYRLRPKHEGVQKIPALKLVYFDPQYAKYQVAYSRSIPLDVKPRSPAQPPAEVKVVAYPERFYELATGPRVLYGGSPGLSILALVVLLLVPPAACTTWYGMWRRLRPDRARQTRLRRSLAARHALQTLRSLVADAHGAGSAAVLAEYLRRRLDFTVAQPTPHEAVIHLRRAHVSPGVAGKVGDFFHTCDALRFAPEASVDGRRLATEAECLILAVEAEPCLSRPS